MPLEPRTLLAIADDLTGAADCGIALASGGLEAVVLLDASLLDGSLLDGSLLDGSERPPAEVLALDANTRCRGAQEAAAEMQHLLERHGGAAGSLLFKKLDSTLRGHVAAELAALLAARRRSVPERAVILLAPAFPAHGRTTEAGRLLVNGVPLEQTDVWHRERMAPRSSIPEILADAGLTSRLVGLEMVRAGSTALERVLLLDSREADVLVCDATTEADLAAIASASMVLGPATIWAGSAGLAAHLPRAAGLSRSAQSSPQPEFAPGPALILVGSLSSVSRDQAGLLSASEDLLTLRVPVSVLLAGPERQTWRESQDALLSAMKAGRDVLVLPEGDLSLQMEDGASLCAALASFVSPCANLAGSLVATGGETARAVLDRWGISQLRLIGEVEPGLPFSAAAGWHRTIPVLTKAGGFGRPDTLVKCRRFLQELERRAAVTPAAGAKP